MSRLRGIEGLRALAALSILTLHVYLFSAGVGGALLGANGASGI